MTDGQPVCRRSLQDISSLPLVPVQQIAEVSGAPSWNMRFVWRPTVWHVKGRRYEVLEVLLEITHHGLIHGGYQTLAMMISDLLVSRRIFMSSVDTFR
jgi:hypothetical protein